VGLVSRDRKKSIPKKFRFMDCGKGRRKSTTAGDNQSCFKRGVALGQRDERSAFARRRTARGIARLLKSEPRHKTVRRRKTVKGKTRKRRI